MERMGHSTARAAMIYLHSTDERQRAWLMPSRRLHGPSYAKPIAVLHLARKWHAMASRTHEDHRLG
jgi:hypothetical protein